MIGYKRTTARIDGRLTNRKVGEKIKRRRRILSGWGKDKTPGRYRKWRKG